MIIELLKTVVRDLVLFFVLVLFRLACLKEYLFPSLRNKRVAGERLAEVSIESRTLYWLCAVIRDWDKLDDAIITNPCDDERFNSICHYLQQRELNQTQLELLGSILKWLFIPFEVPVQKAKLSTCQKPSYFIQFNDNIEDSLCILYFHGGGYTMANFALGFHTNTALAKQLSANLMVISYDFLPQSTLENIIEKTAIESYKLLIEEKGVKPKNLILVGESAGGNMALNIGRKIGANGCRCIIAHSPWLDLTHSLVNDMSKIDDCFITGDFTILCKDIVSRDPKVLDYSPMFWSGSDLDQLPPLFMSCALTEKFIVETRVFEQHLQETSNLQYQVMVKHVGVPHAYSGMFGFTKEGKEVEDRIKEFIKRFSK